METYFKNLTAEEGTKEKLFHDLQILVQDAQVLVAATSSSLARKSKVELKELAERIKTVSENIKRQSAVCAKATDQAIRSHPYHSLAIAFALGVVVGALAKRQHRDS